MRHPIAQVTLLAENGGSLSLIFNHDGACMKRHARVRAKGCGGMAERARFRAAFGSGCWQGWRGPAAALRNLAAVLSSMLISVSDVKVLDT